MSDQTNMAETFACRGSVEFADTLGLRSTSELICGNRVTVLAIALPFYRFGLHCGFYSGCNGRDEGLMQWRAGRIELAQYPSVVGDDLALSVADGLVTL